MTKIYMVTLAIPYEGIEEIHLFVSKSSAEKKLKELKNTWGNSYILSLEEKVVLP